MTKNEAKIKAKELVSKMTVEEKMTQLLYTSPAIERLGISAYNWWNEGAHGVARSGTATVFPHTIAMAATFDSELINEIADVISTEGRIKYNKHVEYGDHDIFKGITYWAPISTFSVTLVGDAVRKPLAKILISLQLSVLHLSTVFRARANS